MSDTSTAPDYEVEYNNRARVPEHPGLIAGWARDAAAYREVAVSELGIRYGEGPRQTYDLFKPEDVKSKAIVLFIHGGYWQALDPSFFSHMARGLNQRGVPVAVAGYDLCPQVDVGHIVWELQQAAATIWLRYNLPVVAAGHSAGGQLSACLLATGWKNVDPELPDQIVPAAYGISGLYNLKPLTETSINKALGLTHEGAERESPLFWPAPSGLVMDAVVGGAESTEYLKQSRRLTDIWGLEGVRTRYEEIDGANHFTVLDTIPDPDSAMTRRIAELAGA
ncbi:Alpha/beta hydrolase [Bosea sp. 62]|uniref:alpha/beta hydrolase n=1 Tax=unclassified Bosea (in: a-proteobacteria) TaxID=2653178 RepID=UPI001255A50C|nr:MULTISPECIES: alpha/beta hydrolase [unclassified Bosea (in: a-proteobacteria)]CAD5290151.1 Alpha/beta hydrolase [Bosea sp. 7B]CAD5300188.1 Alpha/beta hydrolase [Bosea sp. 21B]CAD5300632.1 Alpha/beta hydrolase [Bosea sp. 46]VVT61890.1 Esterase [Bosea sp. EC-HK365B]VXB45404.1 Alpha/beta hydrolase [Bosea sp. 125]